MPGFEVLILPICLHNPVQSLCHLINKTAIPRPYPLVLCKLFITVIPAEKTVPDLFI